MVARGTLLQRGGRALAEATSWQATATVGGTAEAAWSVAGPTQFRAVLPHDEIRQVGDQVWLRGQTADFILYPHNSAQEVQAHLAGRWVGTSPAALRRRGMGDYHPVAMWRFGVLASSGRIVEHPRSDEGHLVLERPDVSFANVVVLDDSDGEKTPVVVRLQSGVHRPKQVIMFEHIPQEGFDQPSAVDTLPLSELVEWGRLTRKARR